MLHLLWLSSPALPIGAYAYSRGLEQAVTRGWVHDAESARTWIEGVLENQLATLDAPLVARLHHALRAEAHDEVARLSALSWALRESAEAVLEERQLGASLARLLRELGVTAASALPDPCPFAAAFALACVHGGVGAEAAVLALLYTFAEAQVIAASKLVPLGQIAAQRVLAALLAQLGALAARALALPEEALGAYTPGLALASTLHETQYTRLFRS